MPDEFSIEANRLLIEVANALDISNSNFEKAEQRYQAIGKHLERPDSKLVSFKPRIYPQGSFRLGTVVRPISDNDDYDIDLVCQIDMHKTHTSQAELKQLVGDEIKDYCRATNMKSEPKEGKRCWTMEYAEDAKFHMDILPAVPEDEPFKLILQQSEIPEEWAEKAIALTDNRNPDYWIRSNEWEKSNPIGYALWFEEQMKIVSVPIRKLLVEKQFYAKVEDVPAFKWKTPLQRSVQILKRHRDNMFKDETENKPISIIISTLAGHAYDNEEDQVEALLNIVNKMTDFIQYTSSGPEVQNPVNPAENFAEKWHTDPEKEKMFRLWIERAKADLENARSRRDLDHLIKVMEPIWGKRLVENAVALTFGATPAIQSIVQNHNPPLVEIKNPIKPWGNCE